ncbi:M16 family metallopeptidase [Riemerella columbina]|uniref:M16 family metallopeptidase n=1 Tax=Riemerella columbina TaxID=103810 RepID=UPI00036E5320|nr:insulinase family protein [Riemerella columbina]
MQNEPQTYTDNHGYTYQTYENDANRVRIYTLKNGLKVYLAQNHEAPKIQTYIPVRTGSNNDPKDNTGLAHYLEHMMFKGTARLGTTNWEKEAPLLEQLSDLFEQHKAEQNPEKKKEIYKTIDQVSQEAAQYAIANEYDKAISSLGASGTNAHTWLDETVYKNNIPKNELEKWFRIESERFSGLALRLFHTELESVYEEFNRAQDNDYRLVNYELMAALFPNHPNGQQTTLGKAEHLKNPSMVAIHQYFNEYYVPNNYALVLVGDLDFEETIGLAETYFGKFQYKPLPEKTPIIEPPMTTIVERTVKSPTSPRVQLAWRTDSYGTQNSRLATLCAQILSNNGEVGLIDLNINQKHTALRAAAYHLPFKAYGYISLAIIPKEQQTLEEAKTLLLEQIQRLKEGAFPDWLMTAIINDMKTNRLSKLETADGLATNLYETYIKDKSWGEELTEIEHYEKITKAEVVAFAQSFFKDNYAIVYKEKGINDKLLHVDPPQITPISLNKTDQSEFLTAILETPSEPIQPEFVDFNKEIKTEVVDGVTLNFVKNKKNNLAQMNYLFPLGTDHDRELGVALQLFEYMGTDNYTPEALKQEFYKVGISYSIRVGTDQTSISLSGLEENLHRGIALMNHWLNHVKADEGIYRQVVQTMLQAREVAKKDKNRIRVALVNYAKYGKDSRFREVIISQERLETAQADEWIAKARTLLQYDYSLFFYGQNREHFKTLMAETGLSRMPNETICSVPVPKIFPEPEASQKVYFIDYDMVQVELMKLGRGQSFNPQDLGTINVFNEYFGHGLSSIVFQEIRESRSLAYSAYVSYSYPPVLGRHNYITHYIGTQANKLAQAVEAMQDLLASLPQVPLQFNHAKQAALKQIAAQRLSRRNLFFTHQAYKKWGVDGDIRQSIYHEIERLSLEQLTAFYKKDIEQIQYNTVLIGKKENLDFTTLKKMGDVEELSVEALFGDG